MRDGKDFEIDVYVREFAGTRWSDPQALADAEAAVRSSFGSVAAERAGEIEGGRLYDRETADNALDWFESQWPNLCHVYFAEAASSRCDTLTLFAIADSLVLFMLHRGHLDDCERIFRDAGSRRGEDPSGLAHTLNDLAVCLQFKGSYPEAEEIIEKCIHIRRAIRGEEFALAQSFNTAAAICFEQASPGCSLATEVRRQALEKALAYAKNAQEPCEVVVGDTFAEKKKRQKFGAELSQTLSNIGVCHSRLAAVLTDRHEQLASCKRAEDAFQASLKHERPHDQRQGQTMSRKGWLYLQQDFRDLPQARRLFREALPDFAREPFVRGRALWGLGRVCLLQDPPDAIQSIDHLRG